ncbi:TonB-dependent receptor [Sphingobium aquiterrae]|uniref:TonB-dependent receptor n=1 Tax=Sphingobium aquiterrae TaxID=2038656 RepID=UPI00301B2EDE
MTKLSLRAALLAATSLLAAQMPAHAAAAGPAADTASGSGEQSTSANQAGQANDKQSLTSSDIIVTGSHAAEAAPITASLTTTQPQAAVSRELIDNSVASADFNELIALTPSVSISGSSNGAGFSETKATIRGFQDGDYNVTYDSIPFADTNNPTHHSTAFFPSNTIETVVVDRGPGNASQLGQASYGGNINMYSRAVKDEMGGQAQALLGIWNTFIGRAELQSGAIDKLGGAKFVLAGQYLRSDGALTNSPVASKNLFAKAVIPIGTSNTLTLLSTWNRNHYYQSDVLKGATCGTGGNKLPDGTQLNIDNCTATSQIGKNGLNYGLGDDPTQQDYWKYNRTDKTTDFSYIRLQSDLGSGFSMDNRAYMYGYTNATFSGNTGTVVTGFTGAGTAASPYKKVTAANDVLGYDKLNKYRVLGYIGQINYDFSMGRVRLGGWFEHAATDRHLFDLDRTTGKPAYIEKFADGVPANAALPPLSLANVSYLQHSDWNQYQLFGEFEFRPMEGLAITPGVKYVHFTRSIDAAVNQKSRSPIDTQATWTKALPFLTANWQVKPSWAFYAQYAQGMYVPDLSSFYTATDSATAQAIQQQNLAALKPQTSTNYQVGTVWHGEKVSIDVDGYIIDVNNKIASDTSTGAPANALVNIGQVRYKGVEGQLSVMPVRGLTLFANGSYNYARNVQTDAQIAKAPFTTAALGAFYNDHGFRMSFTQKYTGPQYASEYGGTGARNYRIQPYSVGDFAISQEIAQNFRIGATVSNVFNDRSITAISNGKTYGVDDQFNMLPPRSFMVDARVKF